jgi:branched-chain amino acid transport system permease protein
MILNRSCLVKKNCFRNAGITALGLAAAVGIPALLIRARIIDAYVAQIITIGAVNAILAVSVHVLTGLTGILSLGQAAFMTLGAYLCIFFTMELNLPLPLSIFLSSLTIAALGCLLGLPALKLSGDYFALLTLGFGEIVRLLLNNFKSITGGTNGRQFEKSLTLYPAFSFLTVTTVLALILILLRSYLKSASGRTLLAIREDEIAANSYGISVSHYKLAGVVISAFIAGLGGCLYIMAVGFIKPDMASFTKSIEYLIYAVFGGLGSMTGAVIAAYALTCLPEFLRVFSSHSFAVFRILGEFRLLIYALILLFVMISRPGGLFGRKEFSLARLVEHFFNHHSRSIPDEERRGQERRRSDERRGQEERRRCRSDHCDNDRRHLPDRRCSEDRRHSDDRRYSNDRRRSDDRRLYPDNRNHMSRLGVEFPLQGGRGSLRKPEEQNQEDRQDQDDERRSPEDRRGQDSNERRERNPPPQDKDDNGSE